MEIKRFSQINEGDGSSQAPDIKVKHIIQYLATLDPEASASLDKDGWQFSGTFDAIETIKRSGLFEYKNKEDNSNWEENLLFINN